VIESFEGIEYSLLLLLLRLVLHSIAKQQQQARKIIVQRQMLVCAALPNFTSLCFALLQVYLLGLVNCIAKSLETALTLFSSPILCSPNQKSRYRQSTAKLFSLERVALVARSFAFALSSVARYQPRRRMKKPLKPQKRKKVEQEKRGK